MSRSHFARPVITSFIVVALSSPPAWGAPSRFRGEKLLDTLIHVWGPLQTIWASAGLGADPHGGSKPQEEEAPVAPANDEGCNGDPHGCKPQT